MQVTRNALKFIRHRSSSSLKMQLNLIYLKLIKTVICDIFFSKIFAIRIWKKSIRGRDMDPFHEIARLILNIDRYIWKINLWYMILISYRKIKILNFESQYLKNRCSDFHNFCTVGKIKFHRIRNSRTFDARNQFWCRVRELLMSRTFPVLQYVVFPAVQ